MYSCEPLQTDEEELGDQLDSIYNIAQSAGAVEYTDCFSAEG